MDTMARPFDMTRKALELYPQLRHNSEIVVCPACSGAGKKGYKTSLPGHNIEYEYTVVECAVCKGYGTFILATTIRRITFNHVTEVVSTQTGLKFVENDSAEKE